MLVIHVHVHIKEDMIDPFVEATKKNAAENINELGVARFDIIQQEDDPAHFILVEVYKDSDGPLRHKETLHYAEWRKTVASMMTEPRKSIKYVNIFPEDNLW